ncbi:MAG: acyltransferase family protein [Lachnospiraceae bacterium]|nr:acyltransferase family protein [Lachnospiraceae bacterium]
MRTKTFAGIDAFRMIAAFMVVAIHISPFSVWNQDVDYLITYCLGRIAVPFFLMTTGYFVLAPYVRSGFKRKYPIRKYFVKNIGLYLMATLLYLPIVIYSKKMPHGIMGLLKQVFFDGTFYHLWYFPAVIIGCALLMFLIKKSMRAAIIFSFVAYVIGLFGDSYYGIVKGIPWLKTIYGAIFSISSYTRNGIFFAPIFILLGILAAMPRYRCRKQVCKIGCVVSLILMLAEGLLIYHFKIQRHHSMYLFLIPTTYFLFQLLLFIRGKVPSWFRSGSMFIYLIHPAVIILVRGIAKAAKLTEILVDHTFVQYIVVCILSLLMISWIPIQNLLKRREKNVSKRKSLGGTESSSSGT